MKNRLFSLLALFTLVLSSCNKVPFVIHKSVEKEIGVYDIDVIEKGDDLQKGYVQTIKARFFDDMEYIPYVTLYEYASLFDSHFREGITSKVDQSYTALTWLVRNEQSAYYLMEIGCVSDTIISAGSLESAFKAGDDHRDLRALNYALHSDYSGKVLSNNPLITRSFKNITNCYFYADDNYYFALSFLDLVVSGDSGIYFNYNYSHIIATHDVENYSKTTYKDNGKEYTFDTQMAANKKDSQMPKYLIDYNGQLFIFLLDNYYGLKGYKNITSMASYLKSIGLYNNLFSSNDTIRGSAYFHALSSFDDNHTALISVNDTWNENKGFERHYGEGVSRRSMMRRTLRQARQDYYGDTYDLGKDVIYSSDGKTALFMFDSFVFGTSEQVFNEDGTIKDGAEDYDTFCSFLKLFDEIAEKGTVENVIFDIATNGGGTVGVMMKLLALISSNNSCHLALYDGATTALGVYNCHVDINRDGQYDVNDCFGDEYNIYILTTDCSFSCANAFPCSAQWTNSAKIIGQASGGGECAVAVHYLPNSQYVYHSSNLHIGSYREETEEFLGYEAGAMPDIPITLSSDNYGQFFDVDYLNSFLN